MVMSWRRWCGLCAEAADKPSDFPELSETPHLLDVAVKWFSISPRRKCPVCANCQSILVTIQDYTKHCLHVQEMYSELRLKKPVQEEDIQAVRLRWMGDGNEREEQGGLIPDHQVEVAPEVDEVVSVVFQESATEQATTVGYIIEDLKSFYPLDQQQEQQPEEGVGSVEHEVTIETGPPSNYATVDEDDIQAMKQEVEALEETIEEVLEEEQVEEEEEGEDEKKWTTKSLSSQKVKRSNLMKTYIKCRYCVKKFRTQTYLRAHERSHEEAKPGQLPYSCEMCEKRFLALSGLMAHLDVHTDETPYPCDQCDKAFKNITRLRIHQETHSEQKWICPICGLALSSSHTYNKHKFVHVEERRYKCPVCPKDFKKQTALKEHLISHTGMRPYSCPFCDKTFINGSGARLHKVKVHPIELMELEASGRSEEVNAKHRNLPTLEELKARVVNRWGQGATNDLGAKSMIPK